MDPVETVLWGIGLCAMAVGGYVEYRRQKRMAAILAEGPEPAFDEHIRFPDIDIEQAARLAGLVTRVCVMRNMGGSDGSAAGEDFDVLYTAFVVDVNSATHDLGTSADWGAVEQAARRLADELDVEFVDTSYGTF